MGCYELILLLCIIIHLVYSCMNSYNITYVILNSHNAKLLPSFSHIFYIWNKIYDIRNIFKNLILFLVFKEYMCCINCKYFIKCSLELPIIISYSSLLFLGSIVFLFSNIFCTANIPSCCFNWARFSLKVRFVSFLLLLKWFNCCNWSLIAGIIRTYYY